MTTIKVTTVGEETLKAMRAGHNTNVQIATFLSKGAEKPILPETIGSRVVRLRNQGLVKATRESRRTNVPLTYTIMPLDYEISDAPVNKRRYKDTVNKTYAELGENIYANLDLYLYPQKAS